jgi:hypothetical protein
MKTRWPSAALDVHAIRAVKEVFAQAFVKKDARLRASIWGGERDGRISPGRLLPRPRGHGKAFPNRSSSVTTRSCMSFSNCRFRFITPDLAFVNADITLNDVLGVRTGISMTFWRSVSFLRPAGRTVRGCRRARAAYFKPMPSPRFSRVQR